MKPQKFRTLTAEKQIPPDNSASELQRARIKIAMLVQQNSQLEVAHKQTERLLSVQGAQIRERVRAELEKLDLQIQEKERAIQEMQAKSDVLEASLNAKIHELQVQLAEKTLLLESHKNEVNHLKATVNLLLQQLAQRESGGK